MNDPYAAAVGERTGDEVQKQLCHLGKGPDLIEEHYYQIDMFGRPRDAEFACCGFAANG